MLVRLISKTSIYKWQWWISLEFKVIITYHSTDDTKMPCWWPIEQASTSSSIIHWKWMLPWPRKVITCVQLWASDNCLLAQRHCGKCIYRIQQSQPMFTTVIWVIKGKDESTSLYYKLCSLLPYMSSLPWFMVKSSYISVSSCTCISFIYVLIDVAFNSYILPKNIVSYIFDIGIPKSHAYPLHWCQFHHVRD